MSKRMQSVLAASFVAFGLLSIPAGAQQALSPDTDALVEECRADPQGSGLPQGELQDGSLLSSEQRLAPSVEACRAILQPDPNPTSSIGNLSPQDFSSGQLPNILNQQR